MRHISSGGTYWKTAIGSLISQDGNKKVSSYQEGTFFQTRASVRFLKTAD